MKEETLGPAHAVTKLHPQGSFKKFCFVCTLVCASVWVCMFYYKAQDGFNLLVLPQPPVALNP